MAANIKLIITSLKSIANATYQSSKDSSRKTFHKEGFFRLQGSASQVAAILTQNGNPNADIRGNVQRQFDAMDGLIKGYCSNTAGVENVLKAFNTAKTEWQLFMHGG